jgi:predicted lipoprotein with Yx(FWY)xxD motif
LAVLAAACGSSSSTATTTTGARSASQTGTTTAVVTTAKVGSVGSVLVNSSGMTLYRYTPDGTDKSVCTGACAAAWPPLTVPAGTTKVAAGPGVPSTDLGTITRADGTVQVTYKGEPLYTYVNDKTAGADTGQGVENTWFVVSAPAAAAGSATTPTTAASGGYGY